MFVTRLTGKDGKMSYKLLRTKEEAETFWSAVVDRLVEVSHDLLIPSEAVMFDVDTDDPVEAQMTVVGGKAKRLKGVKVNPPESLKPKVRTVGPGLVDDQVLEQAQQAINKRIENYFDWARIDMERLEAALVDLEKGEADGREALDRVFKASYSLKGQGGTFGFTLMTLIADQLCKLIERVDAIGSKDVDAIRVHLDTMKLVIAQKLSGDGGKAGEMLLKGLENVSTKVWGGEAPVEQARERLKKRVNGEA